MNDGPVTQYLGVGVLTDASDDAAALSTAVQMTTSMLRYLAQNAGLPEATIDLVPYLPTAMRCTHPLAAQQTLQLTLLPAAGALRLPDDHLALFTITTRFWKRGRARVIQAADRIVEEFLRCSRREPDQVVVERVPYIRTQRYFAYQVFVKRRQAGCELPGSRCQAPAAIAVGSSYRSFEAGLC